MAEISSAVAFTGVATLTADAHEVAISGVDFASAATLDIGFIAVPVSSILVGTISGKRLVLHVVRGTLSPSSPRTHRAAVLAVAGSAVPVAVWSVPAGRTTSMTVGALTESEANGLRGRFATGEPLLFISHPMAEWRGRWVIPTAVVENRFGGVASPVRLFAIEFAEISRPVGV